jgi:hypothetical protein
MRQPWILIPGALLTLQFIFFPSTINGKGTGRTINNITTQQLEEAAKVLKDRQKLNCICPAGFPDLEAINQSRLACGYEISPDQNHCASHMVYRCKGPNKPAERFRHDCIEMTNDLLGLDWICGPTKRSYYYGRDCWDNGTNPKNIHPPWRDSKKNFTLMKYY